ncbi:NACHT domain-containing protein [Dactylosporangium siamense]|uniref:NACHT domain-containing protein n=1 Tax=Dactylosporangium siamense TaxID=685454 RepID=UPI001945919C|nr:hypothetical protein [Dactylosporangium siamense]
MKFARNPYAVEDPVKWVTDAIDREASNIQRLALRGMNRYILITNMRGSSHLDVGRIDRVQKYLDAQVPVPSQCWWRDDLDRRLDSSFDVKMRHPALLDGQDLTRLLFEAATAHDRSNMQDAISAYLLDQSDRDCKVRFKQIDLPATHVFDLFVDVPLGLARRQHREKVTYTAVTLQALSNSIVRSYETYAEKPEFVQGQLPLEIFAQPIVDEFERNAKYSVNTDGLFVEGLSKEGAPSYFEGVLGGGELLLDNEFLRRVPCVLIEGAPGQGKSTLTQYVAEVHRTRLLGAIQNGSRHLISQHAASGLRLPIRLELRDIAKWLRGIHPWEGDGEGHHSLPVTLEAAIAGHLHKYSGGFDFDVSTVHKLLREIPTILLLDGLDEVADLPDRQLVVEHVMALATRIPARSFNLAIIVTSRPTALPGAPSLSSERFPRLALQPLDADLAFQYADNWCDARSLGEKEWGETVSALRDNLGSPHIAELGKNTMQLSILLNLLYLTGSSLPDKRTELYDEYIKVFLNRESLKSEFVRKNRDLLLQVHYYLAYYLHASAEKGGANGRIGTDDLKRILGSFLRREGRTTEILDKLLVETFERIVAIVSRVEGTYEFEVQPLREYFAARYLYINTPYSPPGRPRRGTRPERFDALAINPHWLNVTRFFAGCFDKGELRDLAERVCALTDDESKRYSQYGRSVAVLLLKDYVFAQSTRATEEVIDAVYNGDGLRWSGISELAKETDSATKKPQEILPAEAGGKYLGDKAWEVLRKERRPSQRMLEIAHIARLQINRSTLLERWQEELRRLKSRSVDWLSIAFSLDLIGALTQSDLATVISRCNSERDRSHALWLIAIGGGSTTNLGDSLPAESSRVILADRGPRNTIASSALTSLAAATEPIKWSTCLSYGFNIFSPIARPNFVDDADLIEFSLRIDKLRASPIWTQLDPWIEATTLLDEKFGRTFRSIDLAVISGGIRNASERGGGANDLLDEWTPMPQRVRAARRHAFDVDWWRDTASRVESDEDGVLSMLALYAWADQTTIGQLVEDIDTVIRRLSSHAKAYLLKARLYTGTYSRRARTPLTTFDSSPAALKRLHTTTLCLLLPRLSTTLVDNNIFQRLHRDVNQVGALGHILGIAVQRYTKGKLTIDQLIAIATECHRGNAPYMAHWYGVRDTLKIPPDDARKILRSSWNMPRELLTVASECAWLPTPVEPIIDIATREGWFDELGERRRW